MTWSAVQAETDHSNLPFYQGEPKVLQSQTIKQDAGRATALAPNTVMAQIASSRKWVPLTDVDPAPTAGYMVCGTYGATLNATQTITDGSFKVQIDGETAIHVTGLNFSKVTAIGDLPASCVCGTNGAAITAWDDLADGQFKIAINGTVRTINVDCDTVAVTTLDEVGQVINRAVAPYGARCEYDRSTNKFAFFTTATGATASIGPLTAGTVGTDISGAGWLNGLTGVATVTAGTGGTDTGETLADVINSNATFAATGARAVWNGTAVTIISPTLGVNSAVSVLTAGTSGTNIAGSGYLNGLTGTGTATAGTYLDGSQIPMGIYRGTSILAATLVAGDVTGNEIVVGGPCMFDATNVVLEGSLALTTEIPTMGMTIARALEMRGLYGTDTAAADANV